ncbi:MAG: caspase family protein [Deltaproteobacteria bacterium]
MKRCSQFFSHLMVTKFTAFLFILVVGMLSAPAMLWAVPEKYALLIGIDDYSSSGYDSLKGAKNDVNLIKSILTTRFQFKPDHIIVLIDKQATHTGIQNAFQDLVSRLSAGDIAYIHYSGHGSQTPDLNGDEKVSGLDSTWVCFNARSGDGSKKETDSSSKGSSARTSKPMGKASTIQIKESESIDKFDILDDEINKWLAMASKKTDQIVFVSDSCHSGTITRGKESMMTRGIPMPTNPRPHPLGTEKATTEPMLGVRITACRDEEKAVEYRQDNEDHGRFTLFWAQALEEAGPNDTWNNVFLRTKTRMEASWIPQHPQIEGAGNMPVYGGYFPEKKAILAVKSVTHDGKNVYLSAGSLTGCTMGSVYRKYDSTQSNTGPTIKIVETGASWSKGECQGEFKLGDLVILEKYQPITKPIKVIIRADMDADRSLIEAVSQCIQKLPAYQLVDSTTKDFKYILQILHPKKGENGAYIYGRKEDSLPKSFPEEAPECWVLSADEGLERLHAKNLKVYLGDKNGLEILQKNLERIAMVQNMLFLTAGDTLGTDRPIDLSISIWEKAEPNDEGPKEKINGEDHKLLRTISAREFESVDLKRNQRLTFAVKNKSEKPYYVYLINITQAGEIIPFYPNTEHGMEYGMVQPGKDRQIDELSLKLDIAQQEYIRLIASLKPIDIYLLSQEGYQQYERGDTRETRGPLNPLECLLLTKAGKTRGSPQDGFKMQEWTTIQAVFTVKE